jgi:Protein of unknown function (DUF1592)/Protein of unknown function (DUF1588)/Protein of unknown function (DUF1595)/Protein of unknown function (DUF1585)/Protein of unknown function (DUF1587)/Planctomycete cytochrome C
MKSSASTLAVALFAGCLLLVLRPAVPAAPVDPAAEFNGKVRPLLKTYCVKCHNPTDRDGGVDLDSITESSASGKRALWKRAGRRLAAHEMPPDDAKQPTADEAKRLSAWMKQAAEFVDRHPDRQDPGPGPLRRLTRNEYNNTVRDLLGIPIDAGSAAGIPPDSGGEGHFANLAVNLQLSESLTEKYFTCADAIIEKMYTGGYPGDGARNRLLLVRPGPKLSEHDAAVKVVTNLARRAFRRPPSPEDVERLIRFFDTAKQSGANYEDAVRAVLKPVLVSPKFLFRFEQDRTASPHTRLGARVDDHELAVRLSYFIWSSMPDDELFRIAEQGKLSDPVVLHQQVKRMLAHERAGALMRNFGVQWLQLDRLERARPTTEFFPAFNYLLKNAMRDEVTQFLDQLSKQDRSVLEFLDADYTFVNEVLAKHYGIAGVTGDKMQKVTLKPEDHRGGLLGMAAPLTFTSHTWRTSPTQRGKYVLEVIFGTPPPPPPPDVPPLKEEQPKKKGPKAMPLSLRDQLTAHATQPACVACHRKIDPLGFALENYNGIGGWREGTKDAPLDVTGVLPGDTKVNGVGDLKKVILSRRDEFLHNLTAKMLEYALGRTLEPGDEAALQDVHQRLKDDGYKFSALIHGVVDTVPFRERRAKK